VINARPLTDNALRWIMSDDVNPTHRLQER